MSADFENEELRFPLDCQFRVITEKKEGMRFVIETVLLELEVFSPLKDEHESRTGKYQSFSVNVHVESMQHMNQIDEALRSIVGVKMVL